jgi:hypothetical protein
MRHHDPPPHHPPSPPPPHRRPHHERHQFGVVIDAFKDWIRDTNDQPTLADLIAIANEEGADSVAAKLIELDPAMDPDLAIDKVDIDLAIEAAARRRQLHEAARDKQVGLILPLPRFVHDAFTVGSQVRFLVPDDEEIPPHLRKIAVEILRGNRACREAMSSLDVIVCEVFRNCHVLATPSTRDLLDERILNDTAELLAHCRPHLRHGDAAVRDAIAARLSLY